MPATDTARIDTPPGGLLEGRALSCRRGRRLLFEALDISLPPGSITWLRGTNGSGKTSLLRILCGLTQAAEGEVRWHGRSIRALREEFCRNLIYLGHANGVKDDLLAWENIVVASTLSGNPVTQTDAVHACFRESTCAFDERGNARSTFDCRP